MTRDRSGVGYWPEGFWSGFARAGDRARKRIESARRSKPRRRCHFCYRAMPDSLLQECNLLPACIACRESGATDDARYIETAGY